MRSLLDAAASHPWLSGGQWQWLDLEPRTLTPVIDEILSPCTKAGERRGKVLIALQEAYGNVARHTGAQTADGAGLVRHSPFESNTLDFLVADRGPGIPIDGQRPPYRQSMVGRSFPFRRTTSGVVFCRVLDPMTLEFSLYRKRIDERLKADDLPTGGMGMGIMTTVMSRVTYLYDVDSWNFLWLQLHCDAPANAEES